MASEPVLDLEDEPATGDEVSRASDGGAAEPGRDMDGARGASETRGGGSGLVRATPCWRGTAHPGMKPVLPRAWAAGLAAVVESTGACAGGASPGGIKVDPSLSRPGTAGLEVAGADSRACEARDAESGMKIELFFPFPGACGAAEFGIKTEPAPRSREGPRERPLEGSLGAAGTGTGAACPRTD